MPKIMVLLAAGIAIGTLGGCGSDANQSTRVSGKLVISGDKPLPKSAMARVSMIEQNDDGGDKRIVAERTLHNLGRKPIGFNIDVARNLIDPDGRYGLRAEVVGSEGRVLWQTLWPVAVKPLEKNKAVSLKLRRVLTPLNLTFHSYRCADGFHLSAARTGDEAVVRLGKRRLLLNSQPGENGTASFSDKHGNRLQIGRAQTTFRVDGNDHAACKTVSDQQAPKSK